MSEAQGERGGVSADQAGWGEDKLTRSCCQICLTSSCLINTVGGESGVQEAAREAAVVTKA